MLKVMTIILLLSVLLFLTTVIYYFAYIKSQCILFYPHALHSDASQTHETANVADQRERERETLISIPLFWEAILPHTNDYYSQIPPSMLWALVG